MKKNILLAQPPLKYTTYEIPWGIVHIAAAIKNNFRDADVNIVDIGLEGYGGFKRKLQELRPRIVGIYMDILSYGEALKLADISKKLGAKIIIGGPHPSIIPESVIKHNCVDAICIGEGENAILDFVRNVYDGKGIPSDSGIWSKEGGMIFRNDRSQKSINLDELSITDLKMLDTENYIKRWGHLDSYNPRLRGLSFIVSRGCIFDCSFCQPTLDNIFGANPRIKSANIVIEEIKKIKNDLNLQAFYFQDDTLTMFKDWLYEFCTALIKNNAGLAWACNGRLDTLDADLLRLMRASGCVKIKVGIETASDRMRKNIYRKMVNREEITKFLKLADKIGMQITGLFMLGGPTETREEIKETINFAINLPLTEARFTISTPIIGTHLFELAKQEGWGLPSEFSNYGYGRTNRIRRHINRYSLEIFKKSAFVRFYANKKRIFLLQKFTFSQESLYRTMVKIRAYF